MVTDGLGTKLEHLRNEPLLKEQAIKQSEDLCFLPQLLPCWSWYFVFMSGNLNLYRRKSMKKKSSTTNVKLFSSGINPGEDWKPQSSRCSSYLALLCFISVRLPTSHFCSEWFNAAIYDEWMSLNLEATFVNSVKPLRHINENSLAKCSWTHHLLNFYFSGRVGFGNGTVMILFLRKC